MVPEERRVEIVDERLIAPCNRCGRIERFEEQCGCRGPQVFKSSVPPVHFVESSQHIKIPAGPTQFRNIRPTQLKKSPNVFVYPRILTTRPKPLNILKTTTTLQRPKTKKVYTEHVSHHAGHTKVIDTKTERRVDNDFGVKVISEDVIRPSYSPIRNANFEVLESRHRPQCELAIEEPRVELIENFPRHNKVELFENEPRRQLEFIEQRQFDNGFGQEIDSLNLQRFEQSRHHPQLELIENVRPCGCNREVIVEDERIEPLFNERILRNDGEFNEQTIRL